MDSLNQIKLISVKFNIVKIIQRNYMTNTTGFFVIFERNLGEVLHNFTETNSTWIYGVVLEIYKENKAYKIAYVYLFIQDLPFKSFTGDYFISNLEKFEIEEKQKGGEKTINLQTKLSEALEVW